MNLAHGFPTEMRRNPFPIYEQLRRDSPLLHVPSSDLWMVFDHEGVKRVLGDHESFSSNSAPSRGINFEWLLFSDPPRHTELRAIVMRAFTPRSIANLEPRIRELSKGLIDKVIALGELDLAEDFATPLPLLVMAEMIGMPLSDWPRLKHWSETIVNLGNTILGTREAAVAASEAFLAGNAELKEYIARLISERRAAPRDDLLTRLVEAEVDGKGLSEDELLRFIQLLIAAGTETTTNLIDNAVLCLLDHPDELARVRANPALLPSAIEEVLRYRSPAQVMLRATRRDVQLHGQQIPAGKMVLAVIGAANRDPSQFAEAARFDVTRERNGHIAFGHGIHFCLGAALSRLEGRVALGELLTRMHRFVLVSDEPWEPRPAFHVHGPTHLRLRFEPSNR